MSNPIEELIDDEIDLDALYGNNKEEDEYSNNPNIVPVVESKSKNLSAKQPIVLSQDKPKQNKPKKRFIIKRIIIDKFNTKTTRVELTPSVCDTCAFDVAAKNFGSYHQAPMDQRPVLEAALQEHKRVVHTISQQHIIDEDQMPEKWLSNNRGL